MQLARADASTRDEEFRMHVRIHINGALLSVQSYSIPLYLRAHRQCMTPAQQLIQAQVKDSVLSLSFGGGFAFERAHSHALRSWDIVRAAVPGVWTDFNAFVDASQWDPLETDGVPHGLPPHSIPFYDWNSSTFSDAHLFQAHVGLWHVLDMKARNPSRVIPSQSVFRPYEQTSKKRQGRMMKDVDLRPLWFIRSDGELGVPVVGELPALWHGDKDYDRPRTTMKIKFDVSAVTLRSPISP